MKCPECGSPDKNLHRRLSGDPLDYTRHDYFCDNDWRYTKAPEQEKK